MIDPEFSKWMKQVDAIIQKKIGLSYLDISDIGYRQLFEDGVSPREAANTALKAFME